jgi:hypothetical protein
MQLLAGVLQALCGSYPPLVTAHKMLTRSAVYTTCNP